MWARAKWSEYGNPKFKYYEVVYIFLLLQMHKQMTTIG